MGRGDRGGAGRGHVAWRRHKGDPSLQSQVHRFKFFVFPPLHLVFGLWFELGRFPRCDSGNISSYVLIVGDGQFFYRPLGYLAMFHLTTSMKSNLCTCALCSGANARNCGSCCWRLQPPERAAEFWERQSLGVTPYCSSGGPSRAGFRGQYSTLLKYITFGWGLDY